MLQVGGDLELGQEALDAEHRAELRVEDLHRNTAVVTQVAREVHRSHAAAADLAVNGVAFGECGGQRGLKVRR